MFFRGAWFHRVNRSEKGGSYNRSVVEQTRYPRRLGSPPFVRWSDGTAACLTRAALLATAVIAVAARAQGPPPPPPLAFSHVQQSVVSGPGHVPCKDNLGNDLPNTTFYTEVDLGPAVGTPTAAVRTRSGAPSYIPVSITFWRPSYAPNWFVGTFQMNPLTYNGQTIPMQPMSFAAVIYPGGTFTQTFTVGPLPSTGSWRHELCFSWTADWYSSGYCRQPLYVVYDWPVYPQQRPWLGVLNDACSWAEGESTASDVARELTPGLFFAQRFAYTMDQDKDGFPGPSAPQWTTGGQATTFLLASFLATSGYVPGNCIDVSDYLLI